MPDYGTARADFPGGDAHQLYKSIRRLMELPLKRALFLCHDYKAPNRDEFVWETTVGAERTGNVHVHEGVDEEAFVAMRTARDETLGMPRLILPSIQVNMRGRPPARAGGERHALSQAAAQPAVNTPMTFARRLAGYCGRPADRHRRRPAADPLRAHCRGERHGRRGPRHRRQGPPWLQAAGLPRSASGRRPDRLRWSLGHRP